MFLSPAERLLQELGVTEPHEIDLEAIAYYVNAHVRYRRLDGCEARIIGKADEAIITVNLNSAYHRKRFSIAHDVSSSKPRFYPVMSCSRLSSACSPRPLPTSRVSRCVDLS